MVGTFPLPGVHGSLLKIFQTSVYIWEGLCYNKDAEKSVQLSAPIYTGA
jgi:hypothetical protein